MLSIDHKARLPMPPIENNAAFSPIELSFAEPSPQKIVLHHSSVHNASVANSLAGIVRLFRTLRLHLLSGLAFAGI